MSRPQSAKVRPETISARRNGATATEVRPARTQPLSATMPAATAPTTPRSYQISKARLRGISGGRKPTTAPRAARSMPCPVTSRIGSRRRIGPDMERAGHLAELRDGAAGREAEPVEEGAEDEGDARREEQHRRRHHAEDRAGAPRRQRRHGERHSAERQGRQGDGRPGRHGAGRDADDEHGRRRPALAHRQRPQRRPDQDHEADDGALQRGVGVGEHAQPLCADEPVDRGGDPGRDQAQGEEIEV